MNTPAWLPYVPLIGLLVGGMWAIVKWLLLRIDKVRQESRDEVAVLREAHDKLAADCARREEVSALQTQIRDLGNSLTARFDSLMQSLLRREP